MGIYNKNDIAAENSSLKDRVLFHRYFNEVTDFEVNGRIYGIEAIPDSGGVEVNLTLILPSGEGSDVIGLIVWEYNINTTPNLGIEGFKGGLLTDENGIKYFPIPVGGRIQAFHSSNPGDPGTPRAVDLIIVGKFADNPLN